MDAPLLDYAEVLVAQRRQSIALEKALRSEDWNGAAAILQSQIADYGRLLVWLAPRRSK